jgi:hypothetical protein
MRRRTGEAAMGKIPLERTIGDTYRFAFSNIFSLFGIAWLPTVLMFAAVGAAFWWLLPDLTAIDWAANPDAAVNQEAGLRIWTKMLAILPPIYLLIYVLFAMIAIGIQRKALGLHPGPVFVYFSLGGEVWRLLGAAILAIVIIFLNAACTAGAVLAVFWAGQHYNLPSIFGLIEAIAVIAGVCWFYYAAIRLIFFVPPVVVAEGGFGLARSWQLGQGNFWRIVAIVLACVFGPMLVLSMVSQIVIMPFMSSAVFQIQQAALDHRELTPQQTWALLAPAIHNFLPLWIAFEAITLPILLGLQNAVSAFAYKNLTQSEVAA